MVRTYLQLIRPANVVTAFSDVLAGGAIVGAVMEPSMLWLCLSTACLYAGGIVFNDFFDAELDAIERPERAIPSGKVSLKAAFVLGSLLFIIGVISAYQVSLLSGHLAVCIVILCLLYDKFSKHNGLIGPLNMGLCRGFNLILGMSVWPEGLSEYYYLAIFPVVYIAAITMVSRGEVHGSSRGVLILAGLLYLIVGASQLSFAFIQDTWFMTFPLVSIHLYLIFKPLVLAYQDPIGPNIGKAVKAGVLSLIVMNAAWIGASGQIYMAILVLLLLPLSLFLSKYFAVT